MNCTFLVELADGTITQKRSEDIQPDDRLVFDGPDAFSSSAAARQRLEAEIAAAGGLDAWRERGDADQP